MAETFGERLRRLRTERGLQQADVVGPGVSLSYVSMLENDRRDPTERVLAHLASVLGVPARDLTAAPTGLTPDQRLRLTAAEMALAHGDRADARTAFELLEPDCGLPAAWGLARSLEALGLLEESVPVLVRVERDATLTGDTALAVRAGIARARCLSETGEDIAALAAARDALRAAERGGLEGTDEHVQALSTLVGQYYVLNMYADAEDAATRMLGIVEQGSTWKARGSAYWNAACVAEARGDLDAAVAYAERALSLLSEGDDDRAWARCAVACAWYRMRHDSSAAALDDVDRLLDLAAAKLATSGTDVDLAHLATERARARLLRGDSRGAAELSDAALARLGDRRRTETAESLLVLAEALTLESDETAVEIAGRLELTLLELPPSRGTALTWRGLADVWRRLGRLEDAYRALERALDAQAISPSPGGLAAVDPVPVAPDADPARP